VDAGAGRWAHDGLRACAWRSGAWMLGAWQLVAAATSCRPGCGGGSLALES
jgi:hypothetical protein